MSKVKEVEARDYARLSSAFTLNLGSVQPPYTARCCSCSCNWCSSTKLQSYSSSVRCLPDEVLPSHQLKPSQILPPISHPPPLNRNPHLLSPCQTTIDPPHKRRHLLLHLPRQCIQVQCPYVSDGGSPPQDRERRDREGEGETSCEREDAGQRVRKTLQTFPIR